MAEFDDNDEIARFRQWWAANGTALIIGLVVGLLVLGGWYGWGWYQNRQAAQSVAIYSQVSEGIRSDNITDGLVNAVRKLEDDYSGTPYAAAAALELAAYYVAQKDYGKASSQLDWAANNANNDGIRSIARARKARVLWAQGKAKAALALLESKHPDSFNSLYAELAGDIHVAQGDRAAAYKAYQLALKDLPPNAPRQILQRKMASVAPADSDSDKPLSAKSSDQREASSS